MATLGALAVPGLAACGGGGGGNGGGGKAAGKTITFGSNASDAVPKKALASVFALYTKKNGIKVNVNTVDHLTFQNQINNYLQGRPQDVFTWFAGNRMKYFAKKGLVGDISDVWAKVGSNFSDAMKKASTGEDGKQYFVPLYNYPWAWFYRKSVFAKHGYTVPKTWDEFVALAKKMKKDGLVPIGFADKDEWPAFGTFDYLNMRLNGYDFHISLMEGKGSWQDPKVTKVFDTWRQVLPYHQPAALGRTWQEAAQGLQKGTTGMYLLGAFVAQQFTGRSVDDLDFFPFPEIDSAVGTDAVEAPIDGFMMAKRPKDLTGAKKLLTFLAGADAESTYLKTDPSDVAVNKQADTSGYNAIQKKSAVLIAGAKSISQFLDRDANPAFASTVAIPSFQSFIKDPTGVSSILASMQKQAKSIYAGD
ncbi:MAG: carbohydrate ABC transporter substrate-binding protein [Streptosporangiales bacterium]|nr:carbohydrate ABC transporter substrate-binding protein [Streptosporangiales bacterium]